MNSMLQNYPQPRAGPSIPYNNDFGTNPVLRGYSLAAVSSVIARSTFVQKLLWKLNRFDQLKDIPELKDYEPLHDPTVVPVLKVSQEDIKITDLPSPKRRRTSQDYYTCADFHELYKSGKLTPSDVVEYLIPLIRRDTKPSGKYSIGFLEVNTELVRAAAKASTERYKNGQPLSVLDGVPLAVKDEVDLKGYKTSLGSKLDFTDPEDRTAWCVEKWQEAGGLIIGKTNMHEIGMDTTNNNPNYGTPLNPHNEGYYTGGSSGGSAYTVAKGICPIALGLDGGGSIRLPSAFCGLYGLKPTQGRVSSRAGYDFNGSVVVTGPIASNIEDLALAYRIMAQPDPKSRPSSQFPNSLIKGLTSQNQSKKYIGIYKDWINRSDPEILDLFNKAVNYYNKNQNYELIDISIPFLPQGQKAHAMTILSEVRSRIQDKDMNKLTYHNQVLLNVTGSHATAQDFLFAQRLRHLQMCHLSYLWSKYPGLLILTPTTPCAGWKIGHPNDILLNSYGVSDSDMSLRSMEYVYLANFLGCPSISCPMGYTDQTNLPVGLMAMAEWGGEEQLITFGEEGLGFLDLDGKTGLRRPENGLGNWIDEIL